MAGPDVADWPFTRKPISLLHVGLGLGLYMYIQQVTERQRVYRRSTVDLLQDGQVWSGVNLWSSSLNWVTTESDWQMLTCHDDDDDDAAQRDKVMCNKDRATGRMHTFYRHPSTFKLPHVHTTRSKTSFINYALDHYIWFYLAVICNLLYFVLCVCLFYYFYF